MPYKNSPFILLMVSSVAVLLVLQIFWFRAVYQDYTNSLKQETNLLFSSTVADLVDSLIWKGTSPAILPVFQAIDSLKSETARKLIFRRREIQEIMSEREKDSTIRFQIFVDSTANISNFSNEGTIRIFSTDANLSTDSIRRIIRPIIQSADSLGGQKIELNLSRNLVESELIQEVFNKKLQEAGYRLIVTVNKRDLTSNLQLKSNEWLMLDEVTIPFGLRFQAYFKHYKAYIWRKMLPIIVFGLMAMGLVIVSFVFLYRSILQQQRLHSLKNDLINNITHELKTPVATVGVVLEALENFGADQQASTKKEYIQIAQNELSRLNKMAESILQANLVGEQQEQKQAVDFDFLVTEQIQSFKPILIAKGFRLDIQKQTNDYTIQGYEESLSWMVYNLLDNAIKYSPEIKEITIRLLVKERNLVFEIEDKGVGIPEKFFGDIFEKFVRVPQENLHDVKGYGLGLAQVQATVKRHNGKISIQSNLGKGTKFTIQLPIHG